MKRIMCILLTVIGLMLPRGSQAEIKCVCDEEQCTCFIQLDDIGIAVQGIRLLLVEKGYLKKSGVLQLFDEDMLQAVLQFQKDNNLPVTGRMDDDTLTCLIWGMKTEELGKERPELNVNVVWVPTDGGERMHLFSVCCDMLAPRMITFCNGLALGIEPCAICSGGAGPKMK